MDAVVEPLNRDAVPESATWDLSGLFRSETEWQESFSRLETLIPGYASYRGTLGSSPLALKACLDFDQDVSRKLEAVYTYAHLRNDEDKTNTRHQANFEKCARLHARWLEARSFMNAEIMSIPETRMSGFLQDAEMEFYRLSLERILRHRRHTLSENEEALLAAAAEMSRNSADAFGMLDNADLRLGQVQDENGRTLAITHGNFQSLMQNQDRRVRREAFEAYYAAYREHQYTYASLLAGSVKKDGFFSRARRHGSSREQALFEENIPAAVYDNLIGAVRENLEPLYRYFAVRKRVLGLDELHAYDCAVPLARDVRWRMSYEEAVETIAAALAPLGAEYVSVLRKGLLEERWTDRYENRGKRSGAYSSGCYDSHPFILMNYKDDNINSLYTLAHEAGHSMHSWYSRRHQPYLYADYTIFVAEVASTFNEALITRHLLGKNPGREMKIYLLCREIDNFRGTLFRQTMFAEFEQLIHRASREGEPLTGEAFKGIYRRLLETYFGAGVVLDEPLSLECFRIPHFYHSFYVYKYATGISAAYALAQRVLSGGPAELGAYLDFLKSGGSKYPIDLLRDAGIDMLSPQPVRTALGNFAQLVDQLEALTA